MEHDTTPTRRSVVTAGAAAALGVAGMGSLAACGSGSTAGSVAAATAAGGAVVSPAAASAPAGDDSASAAAGGGGGGAVVKLADVPVGGAVVKEFAGAKFAIAQPTAGTVVAFSAICTHQGCEVAPQGKELKCPCHGSAFNAFTGAVLNGPASSPLKAGPTLKVSGADVVTA